LCCGDGFGYGSSGTQANDALNVARCMKNTDDLQWFCFAPIDHQVPGHILARRAYKGTRVVRIEPVGLSCGSKRPVYDSCFPLTFYPRRVGFT
jgi:hypothetical protein